MAQEDEYVPYTPVAKVGSIEDLIPRYGNHKEEFDKLKKVCDTENKEIKDLFKKSGETTLEVSGWKATYSTRDDSKMNMDRLMEIIKEYPEVAEKVIKTKEYVDEDALESALYNNLIPAEGLAKIKQCEESKVVETLRISRIK